MYLWILKVDGIPTDEQRLLMSVLDDYNVASRPVYNASKTVTVKFGITLAQLSDMVSLLFLFLDTKHKSRHGKGIRIPDEQRLLRKLLYRYKTESRPVYNASHTVTVKFGLTPAQIADMVSN